MNDKRLFLRLPSDNKVKVILKEKEGAVLKGFLINFSEDGVCIELEKNNLKLGSKAEIEFNIDGVLLRINSELKWLKNGKFGFNYLSDVHNAFKNIVRKFYENTGKGFFLIEVTAYLKDINLYGTGYFSRYFEWQGVAREEYFLTVKNADQIMSSGLKLITKSAWIDYVNHCYVFDKITLKIQNRNIKKFSFEMLFTYFNSRTKRIIAYAGQTLVFADAKGKLVQIPQPILDVISKHKVT